jgi:hypothetical protein
MVSYWNAAIETGEPVEIEGRLRRFDGEFRWFLFRANAVRDESGAIVKWYGTNTDIDDRKRAEEQVHRSEAFLVEGQRLSRTGTFSWNLETGEIRWSEELYRIFDFDPALPVTLELIGSRVHPEDLPMMGEMTDRARRATDQFEYQHRIVMPDGSIKYIHLIGHAVRDAAGHLEYSGAAHDITQRRIAEQALEASERNLSMIINTIPALAWSARPDGAAEFFNQRWHDYTGLTSQQAEGWGWKVAIHPDDLDRMVSYWNAAIETGEPVEIEGRLRRFDGEFRWFLFRANAVRDESGAIVKWYGTNTDIDDRKRAEEQVHRSEAFLEEGQRLSRTGTYSWRPDTNEIAWSKELYRIFEVEPDTPISLDVTLTRIHPDDIPSVREVQARGLRSASDYEHSFRVLLPDGRIKFVHVMARATRDGDGRPEFIGAAQDITETKFAEEALNRARSELAHVSRVTTLNALTASITHEINQPLASLITNASISLRRLNAEPPNVEGARETVQRTIRDANRATDVITRLRALFSKKEFRLEPLDLNEVTREVIALSLNDLQRNEVILRAELVEDIPPVIGDRVQLQQVTLNLLRNASDAMAAIEDRPRQLLITTQREGDDRVCLSVQDSGCGVNPQEFERLFEAFYTTKRGGMGIGLSVSRSIIERHHGRLWAEKNHGPGTTFSFSIPCTPESAKYVSANAKDVST